MVFSARTRARMGSDVGVQTPVPPPWVPVRGPCASPYMCPLGTHDIHLTRWRRSKRRSTPRIPSKQGRLIGRLMCFCMQLYPQSLDNQRRRMMSRAWCAGPSVPEGDNEHGVRKYRPYYSDCGNCSSASTPTWELLSPLSEALGSVDASFKSPLL